MKLPVLAVLAALALGSTAAHAENGDATDRAFAALLTQPAAAPQTGRWILPDADDYQGWNEDRLIRWLAAQQKAGANFNAYRHFGTLLHHAIRAGLDRTALWLLQQGADPRLKLQSSASAGNLDALELARDRNRPRIVKALQAPPFNMALPKPPAVRPTSPATGSPAPAIPADVPAVRRFVQQLHLDLYPEPRYMVYEQQLTRSLASAQPVLQQLSPALWRQALDDDPTLEHWLGWASVMPADKFPALLQTVDGSVLQKHARAALRGMSLHGRVDFTTDGSHGRNPVHPDNWKALLARLPGPLDQAQLPPLLAVTEPDLWPLLFQRGYRPGELETELGRFLAETPPEPLSRFWPDLAARFPGMASQVIPLMLAPYRPGGDSDCRWEWTALPKTLPAKINFVRQQGASSAPLALTPSCLRHSPPEVTDTLIRQSVILPLSEVTSPVLVPDRDADCRFTMSDTVYRMLYRNPVIGSDRAVYASGVSLMTIPGEETCGLLLSGDEVVDPYIGGDQDSFDGPTREPTPSCPDPTDATALYRLRPDQTLELLETPFSATFLLTPVRDTRTNQRYWLSYRTSGRCNSSESALLRWQSVNGKPALVDVEPKDPVWQIFEQECDTSALESCPAFKELFKEGEVTDPQVDPKQGGGLAAFINAHRAQEHRAYLTAVEALDKATLRRMESQGVPPFWTLEAMQAVSQSPLPIPDKRKRLAWLFKDHEQLKAAFSGGYLVNGSASGLLETLSEWLPLEDWGSLLKLGVADGYLRGQLKERGQTGLACKMDRAAGLNCGETWEVGE
ncbi:hypothetical protein EV700_2171 [Fluviicoccus keumensis]|uniref:Ankyrin repeat protein n=1 Tax=Fluviicoccus keumensis TaxID=1435465 RepID=A0A4Q7Z648_9GAMM|nr:hypothetical protein [Fluviicoccus keumensis]RZU45351.1 hypothetical protein EV700_2171 [Fluviicoccus keumensis]